jgi:hypothetical protein
MANNKIQIKRSVANATVTGLSNGELAFTQASNTIHIGLPDGSGVLRIGGAQYPGVLTNNHALVANTIGAIDKVIVANATITSLVANGSAGTNGQVLVTNGTAVYWGTGTSGANTYVQFNDSGVANGTAGFTFDKTSNTLSVGNNVYTVTVNAATYGTGGTGTGVGGFVSNSTVVFVGNNTVNTKITAGTLSVNGAVTANNSGAYPQSNTVGNALGATTQRWAVYANTIDASGLINGTAGATITGTTNSSVSFNVSTNFTANTSGVYHTGTVNALSFTVGAIGTGTGGTVQNTTTMFIGNNTVNTSISSAGLSVNGATIANNTGVYTGIVNAATHSVGTAFVANSTKVTFTGANIDATSAWLKVADLAVSGNVVVSGSVVSVNTQTLVVNDNIIELADNNTTTDIVDAGWYSPAGNSSNIWYSGLIRQAAKSSNSNPYFWLFGSNTNPNTSTTVDTSSNSSTGTLEAYLAPYGTGGAFVVNSSTIAVIAGTTVNVSISANTLTLATALAGTSGGTGKATVTNNALLVGNSTNGYNELNLGTSGYVLQSNGTAIVYDILDGGSF